MRNPFKKQKNEPATEPANLDRRVIVPDEPEIYPCSIDDYSPESYLPPDTLRELWSSLYLNPLNYGESMRKEHAAEYEKALQDSINRTREEISMQQKRLSQYHQQRGLLGKAREYISNRRRRRNPQP